MRGYINHLLPGRHMTWHQDPKVWETMDALMLDVWPILKPFIDELSKYKDDIDPTLWTLLGPGLGNLVHAYNVARNETNTPAHSLTIAINSAANHSSVQNLMRNSMNMAVDSVAEGMK